MTRAFFQKGIQGVIVQQVERGSPAARAGIEGLWRSRRGRLMLGDVIVAVDGRRVDTSAALRSRIGLMQEGDRIELTFIRSGRRQIVTATVGI